MKKLRKAILMFIIVFLLLLEFRNFKLIDALVKRTNQQTNYTQQLEQEVKQLETSNARLESNIVYQHSKIEELREAKPQVQPQVKVNYITKQEEPKQDKVHIADMLLPKQEDVTAVIIGTLATLGGMVKVMIPQF